MRHRETRGPTRGGEMFAMSTSDGRVQVDVPRVGSSMGGWVVEFHGPHPSPHVRNGIGGGLWQEGNMANSQVRIDIFVSAGAEITMSRCQPVRFGTG